MNAVVVNSDPSHAVTSSTRQDRRALWLIARCALIGVTSLISTALVVEFAVDELHIRPAIPAPFNAKILAYQKGNYDTLFIGSSRMFHGINPEIFDREMARRGTPTKSFNLSFDALNFPELKFIVDKVLADPRCRLKYLFIEPSLRARLAPGLETSQRALVLHDAQRSIDTINMIVDGNQDWYRKLFWLFMHLKVSTMRLMNVDVLGNRFIRQEEPVSLAPDGTGPSGNGYLALASDEHASFSLSAAAILKLMTDQEVKVRQGRARELNAFEISELTDIDKAAAAKHVKLVLLTPPTAADEAYAEFSAVNRAAKAGRIRLPTLSFTDPVSYYDLYDPAHFVDPDHIDAKASSLWSMQAADAFADLLQHTG